MSAGHWRRGRLSSIASRTPVDGQYSASIGAVTIAEAIETEEQLQLCRDLNIELGQGYIFARPAPWSDIKRS